MVDAISATSVSSAVTTAAVQKTQNVGDMVDVAMLRKTLDIQSSALDKLLKSLGIGNNVDFRA